MAEPEVKCKICSSPSPKIFHRQLLQKYAVSYYQCSKCGFTQTETPYWLDEAYADSMNLGDTGQVSRNIQARRVLLPIVKTFFDPKGLFLDYAGGYGFFTRFMRDSGLNFFWDDLYTPNLLGKGFERPVEKVKFELVTTFECFEHWANPMEEISKILEETDSIFFTTNLISVPAPAPDAWWYYGFDHGQHVALYSQGSMQEIAQKFGLNFHTKRGYHLFTRKKINALHYKIVVELAFRGLLNWIGGDLGSLIQKDHELLVERRREQLKNRPVSGAVS